ncbi:MAG: AsmA family protein, partial [Bryobacteraceae bacterium]
MRRVGIIIAGIVGLLVIAALVFAATFNVNKYRGTIQSQLQKHLGRSVTLGDMHLRVFPPRFRVQDLAIADDTNFSADTPFVKAQVLNVSVKLLPLLHKTVEVKSLDLQRPSVNLIKNQAGVWNFASLGHPEEVSPETPREAPSAGNKQPEAPRSTPSSPSQSSQQQLSLGELTITDGQLSLLDQQKSKVPSLYDHIDVTLKNFSPNKPFTVEAAAHISGAGSQEVTLQGEGGPVVQGQPALTRFHGTLNVKQVGIADLAKFLNSPALAGTDGILTGQTRIDSETGKLVAKGETNIQSAKVHGMELGYPISAQYDLTDDLALDVITLHAVTVKLGEMPVKISGTVNSKASPPLLDMNMQANNVSIAEAGKLAAASGMALSQGTMVNGNVNANIQARGAADKPAMTGTIIASNVQMSGKDIAQPVQIPSVNLNLTPAEIKSNPFSVISGGTTVNSQLSIRNYLSPTPTVDAVL